MIDKLLPATYTMALRMPFHIQSLRQLTTKHNRHPLADLIFTLSCVLKQTQVATAHQIWEAIKKGDVNALKELYQLYHQDLFQYGKRMTKDEQLIEDALQMFLSRKSPI